MTISFDFDNTISAYPEFFATLGRTFVQNGHTVFILTLRMKAHLFVTPPDPRIPIISTINQKYGDGWYSGLLTWDLHNQEEQDMEYKEFHGQPEFGGIKMAHFKLRMIKEYDIDVHFEDDEAILRDGNVSNVFMVKGKAPSNFTLN